MLGAVKRAVDEDSRPGRFLLTGSVRAGLENAVWPGTKRYLIDPALIAAGLRTDVAGVMRDGDLLGRVLETFVAAQLRPELAVSASRPRLHHLRTEQGGHEIDLLGELAGSRLVGIEVKASGSPTARDARHLAWLRDELGERFAAGVVLHTGPRLYGLGESIVAAPICALWA